MRKMSFFLKKNHKNLCISKNQGFGVFTSRLSPEIQFEKNCTQNPYFLQKFDFCIFEPKNCEVIKTLPKHLLTLVH